MNPDPGMDIMEAKLRLGFGVGLWIVSGGLTAMLFFQLAGEDLVRRGIMLAVAILLEGSKVLTWRMGGPARGISISLICFSIVASLGGALVVINDSQKVELKPSVVINQESQSIQDIDHQVGIMLSKLDKLPADYVTADNRLNADIQIMRSTRAKYVQEIKTIELAPAPVKPASGMIDLIAVSLGIKSDTLWLALLMALSIIIELTAMVLVPKHNPVIKIEKTMSGTLKKPEIMQNARDFLFNVQLKP